MSKRLLPTILLILYIAALIKVMVFKSIPTIRVGNIMLNFGGAESGHPSNFVPFATIGPYLLGYKGWIIAGINLIGNIILLVPVGLLAPLVFRTMDWKKALSLAIISGLVIETLQTVLHVGIFDIDDVILNALGVMIGYWICMAFITWIRSKQYKHVTIATIVIVILLGAGLYEVHQMTSQPVNFPDGVTSGEGATAQGANPCGTTNGTGEITDLGNHAVTIKRNDGLLQTFMITAQTVIKDTNGPIAEGDLKIGERVTLVVMDSKNASAVLVCS